MVSSPFTIVGQWSVLSGPLAVSDQRSDQPAAWFRERVRPDAWLQLGAVPAPCTLHTTPATYRWAAGAGGSGRSAAPRRAAVTAPAGRGSGRLRAGHRRETPSDGAPPASGRQTPRSETGMGATPTARAAADILPKGGAPHRPGADNTFRKSG